MDRERERLAEDKARTQNWKRWGPYLSERQWGTVREDYSKDGSSWDHFTHDDSRKRAYRWGEDGLQGWCDRQCRLCFSLALWNTEDPILKERLYGLNGPEGNHGEDVKECYYYKDSTPTHSYTKALYRYPQKEFPYEDLLWTNEGRTREEAEYELEDTGIFEGNHFFDVVQEVCKNGPEDILWKVTATNHSDEPAPLHLLPTIWFRNTWRFGIEDEGFLAQPFIQMEGDHFKLWHQELGTYRFYISAETQIDHLFTENENDNKTLFGAENHTAYVKDGFHKHVVDGDKYAVNPDKNGTKAAAYVQYTVPPGESVTVCCRLTHGEVLEEPFAQFEEIFTERRKEADDFYDQIIPEKTTEQERRVYREGYAGLLWTKQFYYYVIDDWLKGDHSTPSPPQEREHGRNSQWQHFFARDLLSMPDKWEYPWFAAWDTAFHMIPFAAVDPDFAKHQLLLLLREWYMHPNGQLPAYEWNFSDVNPPVHAWAIWRVYKISNEKGERDLDFLERGFQKLLLNFTWWVNRKDINGQNLFGGGFLGLDNIGVFDRSQDLPNGGTLHQADGTAWMASFCLTMLSMALELAQSRPAYEDIASKFLEHFVAICDAINTVGGTGLWDEEDSFYYDQLIVNGKKPQPMKIRSLVGLLPLTATTVLKQTTIDNLPGFKKRMDWFLANRPDILKYIKFRKTDETKNPNRWLLAVPSEDKLRRTLDRMLDTGEFLSDFGIRSLSKAHLGEPFVFKCKKEKYSVSYTPGESTTGMFGGNSNWRGPIWFPTNFVLIEALERYYYFYGDKFKVQFPTGSGEMKTLREVSIALCDRLISIFLPETDGRRPFIGKDHPETGNPLWDDQLLFHEYFHGDTGKGLGASHQTGWTSLVVRLIRERREKLEFFEPAGEDF